MQMNADEKIQSGDECEIISCQTRKLIVLSLSKFQKELSIVLTQNQMNLIEFS